MTTDRRFQTYSLALRVLEETASWISQDPTAARHLARLAQSIAALVNPRTCGGSESLADLKAYAIAMEANSLRVRGRLQASLRIFRTARAVQERGGSDPDLRARIDFLESSLHRDVRQLRSGRLLLDRAAASFFDLENYEQAASTLTNRSILATLEEDYDRAVSFLEQALRLTRDPKLVLAIRHNFTEILIRSGNLQAATRHFRDTGELYRRFDDPLTSQRRIWLEGFMALEIGEDLRHARELLVKAVTGFAGSGFGMDAALARMDLEILRRREASRGGVRR